MTGEDGNKIQTADCRHPKSGKFDPRCVQDANATRKVEIYGTSSSGHIDGELIGSVEVCTEKKCYPVKTEHKAQPIAPTSDGTASLIGHVIMSASVPVRLKMALKDHRSAPFRQLSVNLVDDLKLEMPVGDALILVDIIDTTSCRDNCLQLGKASVGYKGNKDNGIKNLFYTPSLGIKTQLSEGVRIEIPAHALKESTILHTVVDKGTNIFPHVEVIPDLPSSKEILIEYRLSPLDQPELLEDYEGEISADGAYFMVRSTKLGKIVVPLKNIHIEKTSKTFSEKSSINLDYCLSKMTGHKSRISWDLYQNGWSLIKDCEAIPPYVNTIVVETNGGGT